MGSNENKSLDAILVVVEGIDILSHVDIRDKPLMIGRSPDCALMLDDGSVSRRHCSIWREGERVLVHDLDSRNGVLLNGRAVHFCELRANDRLEIGNTVLRLVLHGTPEALLLHDEAEQPDALTDLLTRQRFFARLHAELDAGHLIALVLMDMDHFDRINHQIGRVGADVLLRQAAGIVRGSIVGRGFAGRVGGQEFLVALHDCSLGDATAFAEDCRRGVEALSGTKEGIALQLSASFGVCCTSVGRESAATLMGHLSKRLLRAKELGRNQVCSDLEERSAEARLGSENC